MHVCKCFRNAVRLEIVVRQKNYKIISVWLSKMARLSAKLRKFNLIVLGSSIEGLSCAKEAAKAGAKVCVVSRHNPEKELFESIFLNFLRYAANCGRELKDSLSYGWKIAKPRSIKLDWTALMSKAKPTIKYFMAVRLAQFSDKRIYRAYYNAKFLGKVAVAERDAENLKEILIAEHIIIAPSVTKRPIDFPGAKEHCMGLKDLLKLQELEGSILVIVEESRGLQLAAVLLQMDREVSILLKGKPFKCYDSQMTDKYMEHLVLEGLNNLSDCVVHSVRKNEENRFEISYTSLGQTWITASVFDHIIHVPKAVVDLKQFDLNAAGIKFVGKKIPTNENFRTNVQHIYALGNVLEDIIETESVSVQLGKNLARYLYMKKNAVLDMYDLVGLIYGKFDYCFVGLSEDDCIRRYGKKKIEVYHSYFKPTESYIPEKDSNVMCYMKVICFKKNGRKILGMHILSPWAANVMQGFAVALRSGMKMDDLLNTVHIFPTVAREFTQLKVTKQSGMDPKPSSCCN